MTFPRLPIIHRALMLLRCRSGNFGLMTALAIIPLMIALGIAVDFAAALSRKTAMQNAADAAALAAAVEPAGGEKTVALNFLDAHLGSITTNDPAAPDWEHQVTVVRDTVAVEIEEDHRTAIMHMFGFKTIPISVFAKAVRTPGGSACILILEPSKADALKIVNANSVISECGLQVNSAHAQRAFYMENQGKFSAPSIAVNGRSKLGSGRAISPPPLDGSPTVADPLAGMAEPVARTAACTSQSLKTINSDGKTSIGPGVYCGGLTVNASDDVTLKPGIYTFRGGALTLNTSAKVMGKDVLFYFEDQQSPLMLNGAAILQISAPTTGQHAGILMFQGRQAKDSNVQFRVNTSAGSFYNGAIYLPYAVIDWNVSGSLNAESSYTTLIAKVLNLYVSGTAFFQKPTEAGGAFVPTALSGGTGVRLVQ